MKRADDADEVLGGLLIVLALILAAAWAWGDYEQAKNAKARIGFVLREREIAMQDMCGGQWRTA